MDLHRQANLALWNEWTDIHEKSAFYDVEGFLAGKSRLHSLELEELGDVSGKSLLHLQCHFGLDTLSWARRGAAVTGVDFSDKAIALAKRISHEASIAARFIQSDVYELPTTLEDRFDIVFTSYGVLTWLRDIRRWAKVIAHFLKPGGTFYIVEFHPVLWTLEDVQQDIQFMYSYFHTETPLEFKVEGSYADRDAKVTQPVVYEWNHPISDILNALISVDLKIDFLHEFPYSNGPLLALMEQDNQGRWRLKKYDGMIPLMFSLRATK